MRLHYPKLRDVNQALSFIAFNGTSFVVVVVFVFFLFFLCLFFFFFHFYSTDFYVIQFSIFTQLAQRMRYYNI